MKILFYISKNFELPYLQKAGFALECLAMEPVREEMGLKNVKFIIPFCITMEEGRKLIEV